MKYLIAIFFLFNLPFSFANHHENDGAVDENPIMTELPTMDIKFVEKIGILTPDEILNILGEPAKRIELKMKSSNDVIARTWYYHNINTDENGRYFPTTELDIVDGYVESVVFMNEVDETTVIEAKKYDVERPNSVF
ncbi:hypothetical protein OAI28_01950 [Methylophilaceae bacterium]|jgi:hypothetical protein|nr:hypothetical protein [Methylophilaceae bacterium]|tara:strand:+ start:219 stop:629 length:411 start_codon:yes stop_codon:yes gene_type:complete